MRVLVYGMQSGGATAFTLFMAQRPDCLALVDVLNNFAAPRMQTPLDMVVKVVATTAFPLAVHMERFRPDRIVLLLRDPHDNYQSLSNKPYRNYSGLMDEKFILFDQVFAERARFDAVIRYEDFVARDPAVPAALERLGWPVDDSFYSYRRRHEELLSALWKHEPELFQRMEMAFGNVQGREVSEKYRDKPRDPDIEIRLQSLCPRLLAFYREELPTMTILTMADFADKQGQAFAMILPDGTALDLTLASVTESPVRDYPGKTRDPFSVFFDGTRDVQCPQSIYRLRSESGWEVDVFLVPVARKPDGDYTYQAVFN